MDKGTIASGAIALLIVGAVFTLPHPEAQADLFHANNFLVGDRAVGLGGAFCAVSDDASAVAYNPAGMAFAQSSKFIGSGTAFYSRRTTYLRTVGSDNFTEKSSGSVPSFFGLLQQVPALGKGTAFGVAFYAPDGEFKSQNDLIRKDDLGIRNFHRTINSQSSTNYFGVGAGTRLGSSFAAGFAANLVKIDELTQEYQEATLRAATNGLVLTEAAQQRGKLFSDFTENQRILINVLAVEPVLGVQWAPVPELAVGLTLRKPFIVSQTYRRDRSLTLSKRFEDGTPFTSSDIADGSSQEWLDVRSKGVKVVKSNPGLASEGQPLGVTTIDEPLGGLPAELRLGLAWFASSRILLTSDVSYRTAPGDGDIADLPTEDTMNYHLGLEIYLTASLPLRVGLFTNNDFRPEPKKGQVNQIEQINYYGGSLILAWSAGNVQIGGGTVIQLGKGKAQKVANDPNIQDVESEFYSAVLSASTAM